MNRGKRTFLETFLYAEAVFVGFPLTFMALTAVLLWLGQLVAKIFPIAEGIIMIPCMCALWVALLYGGLYEMPVRILFPAQFNSEILVASSKGVSGWMILILSYTVIALTVAGVVTLIRRLWPVLSVGTRRITKVVCGGGLVALVLAASVYVFICTHAADAKHSGGWPKFMRELLSQSAQTIWQRTVHDPRSLMSVIAVMCVLVWLAYDSRRRRRSNHELKAPGTPAP